MITEMLDFWRIHRRLYLRQKITMGIINLNESKAAGKLISFVDFELTTIPAQQVFFDKVSFTKVSQASWTYKDEPAGTI